MSENGEIYTASKNFTLPPALTALTNFTSVLEILPKIKSFQKKFKTCWNFIVFCSQHILVIQQFSYSAYPGYLAKILSSAYPSHLARGGSHFEEKCLCTPC